MERTHPAPVSGPVDLPTFLRGKKVVLRPLRGGDVERVAEIQAEPGVARWWGLQTRRNCVGKLEDATRRRRLRSRGRVSS